MARELRVYGAKDGREIEIPQDLDAINIATDIGVIHIDLGGQIPNMVLMRSGSFAGGPGGSRLLLSPMDSGRIAVGVIQA